VRISTLLCATLLCFGLAAGGAASAQDLDFGYVQAPGPNEQPALIVTPTRTVTELHVEITAGGQTYTFDKANLPAGKPVKLAWKRDIKVTEAEAFVRATFADGFVSELSVPIEYSYGGQLSVDLSHADADLKRHTLTVSVNGPIESAEIVAYGAKKKELDRREVPLRAGPGRVTVPWVGEAGDVVLLEVTFKGPASWASFSFSPWFLDIPHEDVLFDTNSDVISAGQAYKLEATLRQLQEVLEKYGDVVPVKLYIAGCTDTVGDAGHNRDLSNRRARAIARWLQEHGYDKPIFYHGFGESLLAVPTGDGVDEVRNRRVLYMVGANPPPGGVAPSSSWTPL
jgi:outer membrane protein OmpA-like peptidoglycan-associated protein